jgi:hypothetical protein
MRTSILISLREQSIEKLDPCHPLLSPCRLAGPPVTTTIGADATERRRFEVHDEASLSIACTIKFQLPLLYDYVLLAGDMFCFLLCITSLNSEQDICQNDQGKMVVLDKSDSLTGICFVFLLMNL